MKSKSEKVQVKFFTDDTQKCSQFQKLKYC